MRLPTPAVHAACLGAGGAAVPGDFCLDILAIVEESLATGANDFSSVSLGPSKEVTNISSVKGKELMGDMTGTELENLCTLFSSALKPVNQQWEIT